MKNNLVIPENERAGRDELILARSVLLANLTPGGKASPEVTLRCVSRYSGVTLWEELLCAAIFPKQEKLVAVVSQRQAEGYSGIFRRHGSVQYVRFFVKWGGQSDYQALGLSHFKVCDTASEESGERYPVYHMVSTRFNADRYWESLMEGYQPVIRAVLSWNQVPELDAEFMPVFGNRVDSQIRIESEKELRLHFNSPTSRVRQGGNRPSHTMSAS
jgi:hypothetical protein